MDAQKAIRLARKHIGNGAVMDSSARVCLMDALHLYERGFYDYAIRHAKKSIEYSVGIFHPDYKKFD